MNPCEQLHNNIKVAQTKLRLSNQAISNMLGYANNTYAVKMSELLKGNVKTFGVGDFGILVAIFKCTPNALFKGVQFRKANNENRQT